MNDDRPLKEPALNRQENKRKMYEGAIDKDYADDTPLEEGDTKFDVIWGLLQKVKKRIECDCKIEKTIGDIDGAVLGVSFPKKYADRNASNKIK